MKLIDACDAVVAVGRSERMAVVDDIVFARFARPDHGMMSRAGSYFGSDSRIVPTRSKGPKGELAIA